MYLLEVLQVPFMVLARPVAWEVGGLLVLDDFGADMELLEGLSALVKQINVIADLPCAQQARQNLEEPWCNMWSLRVRGPRRGQLQLFRSPSVKKGRKRRRHTGQ